MFSSTIKPNININPYCVFCKRYTTNTEIHIHHYYPALNGGYDSVQIVFPTHKICFMIRKIISFISALISGFLFFYVISFAISKIFFINKTVLNLPVWLHAIIGFIAIFVSLASGIRLYSVFSNKIHDYYVLNEEIGEADKLWRRKH